MSFYGSTYFQLIDTFYKILVKNKGGVTVGSAPNTTEWTSQASGRKGILEFGTGNRWIYATQDSENPNSYVFWHAKAGGNNLTKQEFLGGLTKLPAGEACTILTPGSYIKAPQFEFDEAGHIAAYNDVYYQMPISETEKAIEDLQDKVGVPADEAEDGVSTGLFLAVDNINTHITDVERKTDETSAQLGDFQDLFPTTYWDKDNTFYGAFGDIEKLRDAFFDDKSSSKTLSEGIVNFKNATEAGIQGNLNELRVHASALNGHDEDISYLEDAVTALQNKDSALDKIDESLQSQINANKSACDSNLEAEKSRAIAEEARIVGLVTSETNRATGEENRIAGLVTTEADRAKGEEGRIEGLVTSESSRAVGEESRLEGLIGDNTKEINRLNGVIDDNKTAAETAASGLSDRITALETNSATSEALNAVDEVVGQNTEAIATLGDRITQVDENASSTVDAVNKRVDLLYNTVTTQGNTLSNKADSSTVATLETKVDNNKSATDTALAAKADQSAFEALQTTVSNKAETSTVTELANAVSAKANQTELNTLSELVNTKASQESLNDLAATVNGAARADALEKYIAITDAKIAEMSAKIEELTARIEALENPTPTR